MSQTINNSTITNTTFELNVQGLSIQDAVITKCEFHELINNASISGNLTKCLFEGLSDNIAITGPITNMTILVDITPSSAQWALSLSNPSELIECNPLRINATNVPRLGEGAHKDCFIKNVTTSNGNKVVFWVQLITDDNTPSGVILMWSGNIDEVPNGYGVCDGRTINGKVMPDLSGRFIRMIDSGESVGAKNNSDLSNNGSGTRTSYIQILDTNLPIHTHNFNITADVTISDYTGSDSDTYNYSYECSGGNAAEGSGASIPGICDSTGTVNISLNHSHTGSLSNVQVTLNDTQAGYPNNKINVEPNAYALIFIMKL